MGEAWHWRTQSGCWMVVASAEAAAGPLPSLDEVRELAQTHNLIPIRQTFIEQQRNPPYRQPQQAQLG